MPAILIAFATWLLRALGVAAGLTLTATLAAMFSDVLIGIIGQAVGLAVAGVEATGVDLMTPAEAIAELPEEMLMVMKRLRFDDALALIIAAVGIRGVTGAFGAIRAMRRGAAASP